MCAPRVICQLLHGLPIGGAEVLATRLARQLGDRYRFVFVCLDELGTLGEQLRGEGFGVHVLGRRPGVDLLCPLRLAALFRRERVALVHAHHYTPFFYGVTARLLWRRAPVLFTEHGRHQPDYPRRKRIMANRLLLERRDRVIAVGEAVRQALLHNEGIPARRVGVIHNGIDLARFTARSEDRRAVRQELGIGPVDLLLLQVARLDPIKDHATALRTVARVAAQRPDVRLLIVGEGPQLHAIQEQMVQQQLSDRVRLLGLRTDVPRLLAAADVFLLTSTSEGIPLTVLEAMAAGVPVVSTAVGGVGEIIADGVTGLLAPPGDDAALADAVGRLAAQPDFRREMSRRGRERVETLFSETRMLDSYDRLYREMLRV
jgi:L-malate glycosyltransferase